jgi:hypothetical protein
MGSLQESLGEDNRAVSPLIACAPARMGHLVLPNVRKCANVGFRSSELQLSHTLRSGPLKFAVPACQVVLLIIQRSCPAASVTSYSRSLLMWDDGQSRGSSESRGKSTRDRLRPSRSASFPGKNSLEQKDGQFSGIPYAKRQDATALRKARVRTAR